MKLKTVLENGLPLLRKLFIPICFFRLKGSLPRRKRLNIKQEYLRRTAEKD